MNFTLSLVVVMSLIEELKTILGDQNVLTGADIERYSSDWLGQYRFEPLCVVRPASTEEVAEVVRLAGFLKVNIVPVGGNTCLLYTSPSPRDE